MQAYLWVHLVIAPIQHHHLAIVSILGAGGILSLLALALLHCFLTPTLRLLATTTLSLFVTLARALFAFAVLSFLTCFSFLLISFLATLLLFLLCCRCLDTRG
jgi:hypothetical protein